MIEGYTTVKEVAKKWNLKPRTVQIMCSEGKIAGAIKFGRDWAIPVEAERPRDNSVINGEYKGYREYKKNIRKTENV